jgi:hypothetical protein
MDIYLQSRTKNADYYWVSQSTAPEKVHNVPSIIQSVTKFNGDKDLKLIHESEPSMVLLRSQGELLLLVSGLRTKRQDKDRRYIRNSIAWVGEKTDEPILREIATLVLKNNLQILENVVSESSNSSGELFEVNWQAIKQLIPPNVGVTRTLPEQQKNGKIARTSESRTQELANELMQYDLLARDGALVAVTTGFKPKAIFARANVWRGLSNDTNLSDGWVHISETYIPMTPLESNRNKNTLIGLISGAVVIVISIALWISQQQPPPPPWSLVCHKAFPIFTFKEVNKQGKISNNNKTQNHSSLPKTIEIFYKKEKNKVTFLDSSQDPRLEEIKMTVKILQEILIAAKKKLNISASKARSEQLKSADGIIGYSTKFAIYKFTEKYNTKISDQPSKIDKSGDALNTGIWDALEKTTTDD